MKITVLTENTAVGDSLVSEHGLSLYIETDNQRILFDMGQTDAFAKNARHLGIDLSLVDIAVLSHGHYDHGGGINTFLSLNKKAPVYLNKNAFGDHFNGSEKYIGLDRSLKEEKRLVFVDKHKEIAEGIYLISCNDETPLHPIQPFGLGIKINQCLYPETFLHEQYLVIEEKGRKVVFSGCSHKGVLNIQKWLSGDIFIGGFHLSKLNPETEDSKNLLAVAEELLSYKTIYYTAHCTGVPQYQFLKNIMGDKLNYLSTGNIVEI